MTLTPHTSHPAPEPALADDVKKKRSKQPATHAVQPRSADEAKSGFDLPAWAPYAGALVVSVASIGIGALTGSLAILVLGVLGGSAIGLVAARGHLLQWRSHTDRGDPAELASIETNESQSRAPGRATATPSVRRPAMKADDLRTSTASMVSRWRTSTAGVAEIEDPERIPDSTLDGHLRFGA